MTSEPVVVARFHYRHEAELAYGYLLDAGIEAGLFIDDAGGMEVGLAFSNPARLVVHPEQEEEARTTLERAGMLDGAGGLSSRPLRSRPRFPTLQSAL